MLKLYEKETGKQADIYSISEDSCGYPKFLIRQGNQWIWRSAKHYITESEVDAKPTQENIKTNADRIRNMSDEELSYVVTGCCGGCEMIRDNYINCGDIGVDGNCSDVALKWLKSDINQKNIKK